jgi:flavin reductase (DIM6/NTAB) family NADH-FMN oxidoreductase RutF
LLVPVAERTVTPIAGIADTTDLRRAFTLYPRGVMAVAALVDGEQVGLAVSAFVSVSLDPPLILICIDRESRTWPKLSRAGSIGVSVMHENQAWLGRQLASRRVDRFAGASFDTRDAGAMLLHGSVTQLECTVEGVTDGGDHLMVLLRVIDMSADPSQVPLVWHDSGFAGVRPLAE